MKKETIPGKNISANRAFRIMLTGFVVMLSAAVSCAVYFSTKMKTVSEADKGTYEMYDRHYVFITDTAEQEFWDEVYAAALKSVFSEPPVDIYYEEKSPQNDRYIWL